MSDTSVERARREAERFLDCLKAMKACQRHDAYDPCPDRAAARRASLDLTRALAKMRQS